jgi:hypothetical protein
VGAAPSTSLAITLALKRQHTCSVVPKVLPQQDARRIVQEHPGWQDIVQAIRAR